MAATLIVDPTGGGDYTTLAAWWAGRQGFSGAEVAQVKGGGSVGIVNLSGGNADPTIEAFAGHQHDGTGFDTAKAHIDVGASQSGIIVGKTATISGIQFRATSTTSSFGVYASAGNNLIQNCYAYALSTNKFSGGLVTVGGTCTFKNNAAWGNMSIGIQASGGNGTSYLYNNTSVLISGATNSAIFISGTGGNTQTVTLVNNFAYSPASGSGGDFVNASGGVTVTLARNNADSDGSAASFFGSTNDQGSITPANQLVNLTGNMKVKAGADLIGNGFDLGSDVTTDFEGDARPNPPTIGWDEYVAPASGGGASSTSVTAGRWITGQRRTYNRLILR